MIERLRSLFPMPKNPNFNPDDEVWSDAMTEILLAQNKGGGKPSELKPKVKRVVDDELIDKDAPPPVRTGK